MRFGDREINLRGEDNLIARTPHPIPGIVDLCLVGDGTIDEADPPGRTGGEVDYANQGVGEHIVE